MKQLQRLPAHQPSSRYPSSSSSRAIAPDQSGTGWETIQAEVASSRDPLPANRPRLSFVGRPMLRREEILMLHRTIGNQAVGRLLRAGQRREQPPTPGGQPGERETAPKVNRTGLPGALKSRVEKLSGLSLDDVRVHYHSTKPAEVQALAYTQGTEIHVGPGQEKHLAHEAWHVVQQMQGRVQPTSQREGVALNDDPALEHEADVMPARLAGMATQQMLIQQPLSFPQNVPLQRVSDLKEGEKVKVFNQNKIRTGKINKVVESYGYRVLLDDSGIERYFGQAVVYPSETTDDKIRREQTEEMKQEEKHPENREQKEEKAEQPAKDVSSSGKQEASSLSGAIQLTGNSQMIIKTVDELEKLLIASGGFSWEALKKQWETFYQQKYEWYQGQQAKDSSGKVREILAYLENNFSSMARFLHSYMLQLPKVSVPSPKEETIANYICESSSAYLAKIQQIGEEAATDEEEILMFYNFITTKKSEEEIKQRYEEIKGQEQKREEQAIWRKDFEKYFEKYKDAISAGRGASAYSDEDTLAEEIDKEFKAGTLLLKTNVAATKDYLEKIVGTQVYDPRGGQLLSSATLLVPHVPRSPFALDKLAILYSGLKATIFLVADFDLESSGWGSEKWFNVIHGKRLEIARLAQSKGQPASEELYEPQYEDIKREQGKTDLQKLAQTTEERWKKLQEPTKSLTEEQKRPLELQQEKEKYNEILSDLKPPSVLGLCRIATTTMLESQRPALIESLRTARQTIAKNLPLYLYNCDKGELDRVKL